MKVSQIFEDQLPTHPKKPNSEELKKAIDAAEKWFQVECDKFYDEEENTFSQPRPEVEADYDAIYWNEKTNLFAIHVSDTSGGSNDDGVLVKVVGGVATLANSIKSLDTHVINTMHSDPQIQAALVAKMGKLRLLGDEDFGANSQ